MADIEYDDWMSETDAVMWHMERDPILRSTITNVWVLDRMPDEGRFRAALDGALAQIPRLRQRVVTDRAGIAPPKWELDPLFDADYHVRRGRLDGEGTLRDLFDRAAPIAEQAFDKDRPLWELHVFDGMAGGRVGAVLKIHHAISDGVGLVRMTGALMERTREPDGDPPTTVEVSPVDGERTTDTAHQTAAIGRRASSMARGAVAGASAVGRGALGFVRDPLGSSRSFADNAASIARAVRPVSEPLSPIMADRSISVRFDALEIELDRLKAAARAVDGTLNDAFVAAVAGALARYHDRHDAAVESLRMTMPINVRPEGDRGASAGNQFAPARFEVPMGIVDPAKRMAAIHQLVKEQRAEPAYGKLGTLSTVMFSLGPPVFTRLTGSMLKAIDFVTSNVPGPPFPVFVAGARIERNIPFGPPSGSAVNFTLYGYDGRAEIGMTVDRAAVAEPVELTDLLSESLDEIAAVGG